MSLHNTIPPILIAKKFSQHAHNYNHVTPVQQQMAERLIHYLALLEIPPQATILEIGCGTGRLTNLLQKQYPKSKLIALDFAEKMLHVARYTIPQVHYILADALKLPFVIRPYFDLIISNATFQWIPHPHEIINYYQRILAPNGWFIFSTLGPKTFQELKASFTYAYHQLGIPHQDHTVPFLSPSIWERIHWQSHMIRELIEIHYPDVKTFLYTIKKAGASKPLSPSRILKREVYSLMMQYYQSHFPSRDGEGIRVSYDIAYIFIPANPTRKFNTRLIKSYIN
ncbi:MAG: malonyl-ACP O-methyltransferase BioC [Candidatus Bathyarchaeia archaeon]